MNYNNIYMQRALELAQLAQGYTKNNPMVGAVLVHKGRIIGEGYHQRWGQGHAEVLAFNSVTEKNKALIPESTLYVSLEPCVHYGKTPPCTELIINSGLKQVVIAQLDPYPAVAGQGVQRLREAGIRVIVGCMEQQARYLNRAFNTSYSRHRPYILLKWAESADAYIDTERSLATGQAYIFSSPYRQRIVHRARRDYQAILIGAKTALQDNPSLTNRYWQKEIQPIRIILDWHLSLPRNLRIFNDCAASTWIICDKRNYDTKPKAHNTLRYCPLSIDKEDRLYTLLTYLYEQGIQSVYVEGGAKTLQEFIDRAMYDELRVEQSPVNLGRGVAAPRLALRPSQDS